MTKQEWLFDNENIFCIKYNSIVYIYIYIYIYMHIYLSRRRLSLHIVRIEKIDKIILKYNLI